MRYLLDAGAIIDHLTDHPAVRMQFPALLQDGVAVSIVTVIELYEGVYRAHDPQRAERDVRAFLRPARILPLNRAVALRTARVRADLRARNRPI